MALSSRALPNSSKPMSFLKAAQSVQPLTVLLSFGARLVPACQLPAQLWMQRYLLAAPSSLCSSYRGQKSSGTNSR